MFATFVNERDFLNFAIFKSLDKLFEFFNLMSGFVFGVIDDGFGALREIDLFFVVDEFGKGGFHFGKLLNENFIVGLDFFDEGMVGFDDSGDDSGHEFDDRLKFDRCLVVFLDDFIFLFYNFFVDLNYSRQELVVHGNLVVNEEGVLDGSFFVDDGLIVVEKFEMLFFSDFDIFDDGIEILVEMFLDKLWITKVEH